MAYVVTGEFESQRGLPTPCCSAQLSSETQVIIGLAGAGREGATGGCHSSVGMDGAFDGATGGNTLTGCGAKGLRMTLVLTQLIAGILPSLDGRAGPATQKNIEANKIPTSLCTRPLCGMEKTTQAVSAFTS